MSDGAVDDGGAWDVEICLGQRRYYKRDASLIAANVWLPTQTPMVLVVAAAPGVCGEARTSSFLGFEPA